MPSSGKIAFFLGPTTISFWVGDDHRTLLRPKDPQKLEALFRDLIREDQLEEEELETAVREMMRKAAESPDSSPLVPSA